MKAVLKKKNKQLIIAIRSQSMGSDILGSTFSIPDDGGAFHLVISLAQGSSVETQLVCFPGQQGFRNSTATQHGAAIYKS